VLGNYKTQSLQFEVRNTGLLGTPIARMCWVALAQTKNGRTYRLEFEPYGGRLVHLMRMVGTTPNHRES
jgi:hypothetical protein